MRKNDYQAFASSFLDLWQEQIARAMSDTDFLQALMENMQQMQAGVFGYDAAHKNHFDVADAPQPEPDELADLQRRLAAAERKVIKLEATIERLRESKPAAAATKPRTPAKRAKPAATKPKPAAKPAAKGEPKPKAKPATKRKTAPRKRAVKRS